MGVCCEARKPGGKSRSSHGSRETLIKDSDDGVPVWKEHTVSITNNPAVAQTPNPIKARFLDRAYGRYSRATINDVRAVWELIPIFICFPCFWALHDQQSNSWEQQAEAMNTIIFEADQMSFWNPLMLLLLIPIFDKAVYPFWHRCQPSVTPLHKIGLGMVFSIASYCMA